MLELTDVSKLYGAVAALSACSFAVRAGRLTGFVGPNGAGKTTAMRAVFGLVVPDAGLVRWCGHDVTGVDRRRFGYMPEERGLYPRMQVADQLVHLGRLSGMSASTAAREADSTNPSPDWTQLAMETMSGLLAQLAHAGVAVLFSSHQLDVVEHLCEDVVVIDRGHVVMSGDLDAIRDAASERYLDVTVARDPERLLRLTDVVVVAHDGNRVRLRVPRDMDPVRLVDAVGGDIERLSYEPPTLSEFFHAAVSGRAGVTEEVSGVAG